MKRALIFLFLSIQFTTLFSQKETVVNCDVKKVSSKFIIDGRQMFYALPRNSIVVEVKVKKTIQYEGPYSTFTPKYLNISEGIIQMYAEFYTIKSAKFTRTSRVDSSQYYSVSCSGYDNLPMLQLSSDGVIMGCNLMKSVNNYLTFSNPLIVSESEMEDFQYKDLGVKPFLIEQSKTLYKTIETDSTPQRVSYIQKRLEPTTSEYNAEEAAAFIRKIRKRRMKLVMGLKDEVVDVDGKSMKAMIDELERYEQQYLELFIGKTVEKTDTYYFEFEPNNESGVQQQDIGWFSPSKGISVSKPDTKHKDYKPIIIKAQTIGSVPKSEIQVMDKSQKTPVAIKYGLYYRIPGRIDITLQYFDKTIARQQWEIAQKGKVQPMPAGYLNKQQFSIEFYPETGALKSVFLNK